MPWQIDNARSWWILIRSVGLFLLGSGILVYVVVIAPREGGGIDPIGVGAAFTCLGLIPALNQDSRDRDRDKQ